MTNSPATRLATAAERADIVARAVQGDGTARIARDLNIPLATVRVVCKGEAAAIRQQTTDRAAVRFLRHDEILTRLIERLYRDLCGAGDGCGWDKDKAAALVKLCERQARLLGLDVAGAKSLGSDEWLAERTDAELVHVLETRYKLTVPRDILEPSRN